MSEETKKEILEQAKTVEEKDLEAAAGGGMCVCVLGGGGEYNDIAADYLGVKCRCVCPAIGQGDSGV